MYCAEDGRKLTCLAMPKSANLISPLGSTNMFAPLMSLQEKYHLKNYKGITELTI